MFHVEHIHSIGGCYYVYQIIMVIIYLTHRENRRTFESWKRLRLSKTRLFTSAILTAAFSMRSIFAGRPGLYLALVAALKITRSLAPAASWFCKSCKQQFSLKVGTIFEDSPLGLDKWMCAYWMLCNCKNGISSCEVARTLGVTQKSAWFMLHRIRKTMESTGGQLSGTIEMDETFVGGKVKNMHKAKKPKGPGRSGKPVAGTAKTIVVGMLQTQWPREGRSCSGTDSPNSS